VRLLAIYSLCVACDDASREQLLALCGLDAAALAPLSRALFRMGCRAQPRPPGPSSAASASAAASAAAAASSAAASEPQLAMPPLIDPNLAARRLAPAAPRASLAHTTALERHAPALG
jgi:hypothetical protein